MRPRPSQGERGSLEIPRGAAPPAPSRINPSQTTRCVRGTPCPHLCASHQDKQRQRAPFQATPCGSWRHTVGGGQKYVLCVFARGREVTSRSVKFRYFFVVVCGLGFTSALNREASSRSARPVPRVLGGPHATYARRAGGQHGPPRGLADGTLTVPIYHRLPLSSAGWAAAVAVMRGRDVVGKLLLVLAWRRPSCKMVSVRIFGVL